MDIGAVVFGEGEGRLELARQVGLAVDRLDRIVAGGGHQRTGRPAASDSIFSPSSQMSQ